MTDHLHTTFRPNSGRDTHGDPVKVLRECDLCTEPAYARGLCKAHYERDRRRKDNEEMEALRERRIARYEARKGQLEPIRFVPVPDDPELAAAKRRYPFVSDATTLEQHRRNPRGVA